MESRRCMDRRRLEDAFFLVASIEVVQLHDLGVASVPYGSEMFLERVSKKYHDCFEAKWAGTIHHTHIVS